MFYGCCTHTVFEAYARTIRYRKHFQGWSNAWIYASYLLAIASGGGFISTLEYDVLANLTLDLYCRSLISVT